MQTAIFIKCISLALSQATRRAGRPAWCWEYMHISGRYPLLKLHRVFPFTGHPQGRYHHASTVGKRIEPYADREWRFGKPINRQSLPEFLCHVRRIEKRREQRFDPLLCQGVRRKPDSCHARPVLCPRYPGRSRRKKDFSRDHLLARSEKASFS